MVFVKECVFYESADTTGAGDIFGGSAMSQLLKLNKSPEELSVEEMIAITRLACCAASPSIQTRGGITSAVTEVDVLQHKLSSTGAFMLTPSTHNAVPQIVEDHRDGTLRER